jgi:hypothetical protein
MDARTDAEAVACSFTSPASFGELFDRHATTMFRYFVRSVGPDDADSLNHSPRFAPTVAVVPRQRAPASREMSTEPAADPSDQLTDGIEPVTATTATTPAIPANTAATDPIRT